MPSEMNPLHQKEYTSWK